MAEVIIAGNPGGREHALALAMVQSSEVRRVHLTGPNVGALALDKVTDLGVSPDNHDAIVDAAVKTGAMVVIGPERPAIDGLGNKLRFQGIPVFGPDAQAAMLEGSKTFAENFMNRHELLCPRTEFVWGLSGINIGASFIERNGGAEQWVLKADGLAGGKGVILPNDMAQVRQELADMLSGDKFGEAGRMVLIQERWTGQEVSVFIITDGNDYTVVPYFAQDYKRLQDGDKGPNTGGMGAYAPVPDTIVSAEQTQRIYQLADRIVAGLKADGIDYKGVLYAGMMLSDQHDGEPGLLEFNVRWGDPEAQVLLPLIHASGVDSYELFKKVADGKMDKETKWPELGHAALTVCLAAEGYPENPQKGKVIHGLDRDYMNATIYHGATERRGADSDQVFTAGGRVLYITGQETTVAGAKYYAYRAIGSEGRPGIDFDGMQFRTEVGERAMRTS